ncbi:MAG: hypothetical protein OXI11_04475 [Gammaproteobacteria bacterium]|nr:hypothetical protein [Gammaproteobacteria bacterium]MXW45073.1 hypothetical protein [Gammaproteobacteria bacterium]MYD01621.1 hypothetical protein [Gammaproteobacteria bacterium]MYI25166.1 hypothetical protein [Gammaproteobacteria bacterium]
MSDEDTILAEANEIDEEVKFAPDAVPFISQVPGFVRGVALKAMIAKAKEKGVTLIDGAFMDENNPMK